MDDIKRMAESFDLKWRIDQLQKKVCELDQRLDEFQKEFTEFKKEVKPDDSQ